MTDKIDEIRARHLRLEDMRFSTLDGTSDSCTYFRLWAAHSDRDTLLDEVDRLRAEVERLRQPLPKRPILGQEAIAGRDGLGRVTEIGPHNPVTDQPEWIGVTPYAGRTWQMNYAPHNVSLVHIRVEAKP